MRKGGIRISVEKSCLFVDSLELCGFIVSKGQIHLTEQRRNALLALAYPTSLKQLRSTIGFIMYVKHFCEDLSSYLRPFLRMLRKPYRLQDTPELRLLFQKLKERLASSPNLYIFDHDKKIVVRTDSSQRKWSFGLFNEDSTGKRLPIWYLSGLHDQTTKNWCIFRLELQALINGLRRTFYLLFNRSILVECDNQVVTWLYRAKELNPEMARYLEFLNNFRFEFKLIKTKQNIDSDFLTRFASEDDLLPPRDCKIHPPCRRCVRMTDNTCLQELGYVDRPITSNSVI